MIFICKNEALITEFGGGSFLGYFGVLGLLFLLHLHHHPLLQCPFPYLLHTGFVFFGLLLISLILNLLRFLNSPKAFEIRHYEVAENGVCFDARRVRESCIWRSDSCPNGSIDICYGFSFILGFGGPC
jgi:hypothetical protein